MSLLVSFLVSQGFVEKTTNSQESKVLNTTCSGFPAPLKYLQISVSKTAVCELQVPGSSVFRAALELRNLLG